MDLRDRFKHLKSVHFSLLVTRLGLSVAVPGQCLSRALAIDEHRKAFQPSVWDRSPSSNGQVLEQVWFAGVHSNIGGSYPRAGLSDITLLWKIGKAEKCGFSIDHNCMTTFNNPKPDPFGTLYDSQTAWFKISSLGGYVRPIGQKANESAASTAVDHLNNPKSKYQLSNLKDFLARDEQVGRVSE